MPCWPEGRRNKKRCSSINPPGNSRRDQPGQGSRTASAAGGSRGSLPPPMWKVREAKRCAREATASAAHSPTASPTAGSPRAPGPAPWQAPHTPPSASQVIGDRTRAPCPSASGAPTRVRPCRRAGSGIMSSQGFIRSATTGNEPRAPQSSSTIFTAPRDRTSPPHKLARCHRLRSVSIRACRLATQLLK